MKGALRFLAGCAFFVWIVLPARADDGFTLCWWNVENFGVSDRFIDGRHVLSAMKPPVEIDALAAIVRKIRPDVLGVAEVMRDPQDRNLNLLRAVLKQAGLDYPAMATVHGHDERIQVVLLSRFPIVSARGLNLDRFPVTLRDNRTGEARQARFSVNRGFVEAEVEVAPGQRLGLLLAHLKSKKAADKTPAVEPQGEEPGETADAVIRRKEAEVLRKHVDSFLASHPGEDLAVMGDLNDDAGSPPLRSLFGEGSPLRALPLTDWKGETWTERSRVGPIRLDHILVNASLWPKFVPAASSIYQGKSEDGPGLDPATASDHRPLVARFR